MSGGVKGYIIVDGESHPVLDDFGAATLYGDYIAAATAARAHGSGHTPIHVIAAPRTSDAPRRPGRPRKQQQED